MTTKSYLQGCATQSAVRHDGVVFERTHKDKREWCSHDRTQQSWTKETNHGVGRRDGQCGSSATRTSTDYTRSPYSSRHSAWPLGRVVLMFGYKGNHGTSTSWGHVTYVVGTRSVTEGCCSSSNGAGRKDGPYTLIGQRPMRDWRRAVSRRTSCPMVNWTSSGGAPANLGSIRTRVRPLSQNLGVVFLFILKSFQPRREVDHTV